MENESLSSQLSVLKVPRDSAIVAMRITTVMRNPSFTTISFNNEARGNVVLPSNRVMTDDDGNLCILGGHDDRISYYPNMGVRQREDMTFDELVNQINKACDAFNVDLPKIAGQTAIPEKAPDTYVNQVIVPASMVSQAPEREDTLHIRLSDGSISDAYVYAERFKICPSAVATNGFLTLEAPDYYVVGARTASALDDKNKMAFAGINCGQLRAAIDENLISLYIPKQVSVVDAGNDIAVDIPGKDSNTLRILVPKENVLPGGRDLIVLPVDQELSGQVLNKDAKVSSEFVTSGADFKKSLDEVAERLTPRDHYPYSDAKQIRVYLQDDLVHDPLSGNDSFKLIEFPLQGGSAITRIAVPVSSLDKRVGGGWNLHARPGWMFNDYAGVDRHNPESKPAKVSIGSIQQMAYDYDTAYPEMWRAVTPHQFDYTMIPAALVHPVQKNDGIDEKHLMVSLRVDGGYAQVMVPAGQLSLTRSGKAYKFGASAGQLHPVYDGFNVDTASALGRISTHEMCHMLEDKSFKKQKDNPKGLPDEVVVPTESMDVPL